ncbi:MAG TPA: hypothetical protein VL026_06860 [Rhizomicrobium sp.]|nr:hypothetical protein [Rhizomicrobium sp.]
MPTKKTPKLAAGDKDHGEGNYKAARDYDERTEKFVAGHKSEIGKMAKDAEKALAGKEGRQLRAAEAKGKSKARH